MNKIYKTAFVTGATGLLGNNLVRALIEQGILVKALVRSEAKGMKQFERLKGVELVVGDMEEVAKFAPALAGCDVVFHTAAFFRENYKGGSHLKKLQHINIDGTRSLLEHSYVNGIRRFVQTSSIAVLNGLPNTLIDETQTRALSDADAYYRSKILADEAVCHFLANFVLPGWMWGPADIGPTSSGQLVIDLVGGKLPVLVPGSFSIVDARDVAQALIAAAIKGRNGERYLAAGRHMTMHELIPELGKITGAKVPTKSLPIPLLFLLASMQELYARISGKPILLSLSTVRLILKEADRTHFNHSKSEKELGLSFRPLKETLQDTFSWYQSHDWLS